MPIFSINTTKRCGVKPKDLLGFRLELARLLLQFGSSSKAQSSVNDFILCMYLIHLDIINLLYLDVIIIMMVYEVYNTSTHVHVQGMEFNPFGHKL